MPRVALPLLVSASLGASGCLATPLTHPLRAHDGYTAEVSGTLGLFSGDVREATSVGYNESSGTASGILAGSLGYAHVFSDHLGVMGGFYGPAGINQHNESLLSSAAAYSYFSYQIPWLSVGVGPEVGYGGFSTTMGLELGPFERVHVGAYGRWFWPFVPAANFTDDHRSHELGLRVRRGVIYVQYGFYAQMNGLNELNVFGTTYHAHAYHQLTLGLLFDASTVP